MSEYLFIRIMEACNAGCFMCGFANSRDRYRIGLDEFQEVIRLAAREGVKYVRLTGGEPLMHREIKQLIRVISDSGLQSSIISNGYLLPQRASGLADSGLSQIIVSIDGASSESHDSFRRLPGLFYWAIEGLRACADLGVLTRVNTVVGPHNFREIIVLQALLTDLAVRQWELSSLKMGGPLDWSEGDRAEIETEVLPRIYSPLDGRLVPMGEPWCGRSPEERDLYFLRGIPPRARNVCHVVDHVRYLDPKNKALFSCSLMPHRDGAERYAAPESTSRFSLHTTEVQRQVQHFRSHGPTTCEGCSATAAGFSNQILAGERPSAWAY